MDDAHLIGYLVYVVGALLGILIGLLGWIGSRIHNRLDSIAKSLSKIERDLRGDLSLLDRRLIKLETLNGLEPPRHVNNT